MTEKPFTPHVLKWMGTMVLAWSLPQGTWSQEATEEPEGPVYELSPFEVTTSQDVGYLSTNSTAGTSLNTAIKDLPMSIQVINQDFITDIAASNLEEALNYSAGVFTSDNEASRSVGATRGTQGGGSGDRSISSAGQGSRFANVVYIRGLSTPFQNRMGFRYGGLVVTPNSDIALGGLLDSANIERIEVVKGPNSLLYGVGVLTGIVNVIPEKPLSVPHYEVTVRGGSYGFLRTQVDFTGPLKSDWIPGKLNYRAAGSYETREDWTAFRENESEYWTVQLDYAPVDWINLFLEYQDGYTRLDGIGAQWIYDDINNAKDSEFRNIYDEAYNWARHQGTIEGLRPLDPDGFSSSLRTIDAAGVQRTQPGFRQMDKEFVGGGYNRKYRITGPDTFTDRDEQNFIADLELTPNDRFALNFGAFMAEQETRERTLQFGSANFTDANNFVQNTVPTDSQLNAIWLSGGVYGVEMQDVVKDVFGLTARVDPTVHPGNHILPATTDDVKLIEYWWRDSVIKSKTEQFRARGTYTFDTPFIGSDAVHTFLLGVSYIKDDVDFPDGGINRVNARANRTTEFRTTLIDNDGFGGWPVSEPFNNDGLYYRSIDNFKPLYFDGRNDGVDGHNTVRAGDAYLNQVIRQEGLYGVYQGRFFEDRLEIILGVRRDTYNATQLTYKRANVTDAFLRDRALEELKKEALDTALNLTGGNQAQAQELAAQIVAENTLDDRFISTWYRDSFESGDQGYFGFANRGGATDDTFGVVPGSKFDIFENDFEVDTFTFGMNYDITPELTIYGLIAEGISPNTALRDGAGEIIPAEETFNKEIGLKFDLMEGKISGSVTAFQIDRENGIWDVGFAPNASEWIDARQSPKRSNDWEAPTYDPASPTVYYVRGDYLINYFAEEFGIDPARLRFAQVGNQLQQDLALGDLDPSLSVLERLQIIQKVRDQTILPAEFASRWDSQAPFGGNIQINYAGINPEGFDDLMEVTMYNPDTDEFITRQISNLPVVYAAFADREIDQTKNNLLAGIHPVRYNRLTNFGMPQFNNNVDFARRALVTFDEEINGMEFEVFITPTNNIQFVISFTHVEREADNTFNFTEWESIVGTDVTFVPPFSMLHREYGWENAGMVLAWVDYAAYQQALGSSGDGVVQAGSLPGSAVEYIPEGQADDLIGHDTFAARSAMGQVLLLVDKRGNVINEANSTRATDYANILSDVSLNFNPENELSIFGKYSFTEGILENLSLTAGFKYVGASETSVAFNTVSPLIGLTVTPEVAERYVFDLGASYRWRWNKVDMRLSVNLYNVTNETYKVTTKTLDTLNPITGREVTKRTEKFYTPTTIRVGLTASF